MRAVDRWVSDPAATFGFRIEPATYEAAELLTGFRLDRRLNFVITEDNEVEVRAVCTLDCSGCSCGCEGGCSCGPSSGCSECGYTGKRRMHFSYPVSPPKRKSA
jgi:hypothetical protein